MTKYRFIAMDLDDTLLTDELTVSDKTREAMARALAQGVRLTIATGRMFASAQRIAKQVGLNVPIITYQGSLVRNLLDEQVLYERSVPMETVRILYDYTREHGLHLQTYIDDQLYSFDGGEKLIGYAKQSGIPYKIEPDLDRLPEGRHTKLVIIDDPQKLDDLIPVLRPLLGDGVHMTKSKANYLEFLHPEGTKGHALRFLAGHFGIPMEETIAIGDAWNDREMIEAAGLGVAMANAVPALREIADYVTLSNNDDGVAHVLEKFVLNA
ncbi:Cof-type HAD-IIB family hydrolase [Cohnella thermotolerans]|jgi:Cof subfamily protein (haloacid dehalogenase superfamily)|uniref:Cof-type HAD-IIB family hydrolase n=1 Tax=Cohnella thermotolerans TaxID=329858 RepID=UPI0003F7BF01|nr:Cof-type HAD-IIB family hydrolase [Cohnella thermotolerans]